MVEHSAVHADVDLSGRLVDTDSSAPMLAGGLHELCHWHHGGSIDIGKHRLRRKDTVHSSSGNAPYGAVMDYRTATSFPAKNCYAV